MTKSDQILNPNFRSLPNSKALRPGDFSNPSPAARHGLLAVSRPLLRWFTWYSRRYIRRHFHSLRVSRAGLPVDAPGLPMVLYTNHASWWDPLVCLVLKSEFFTQRAAFAPIDAAALERYRLFRRLGFFAVEQGSRLGAVQFLRAAENVLRAPNSLLALTPQGRFCDVRERPARFRAGLGRLAARVERGVFVPMAVEYVFWEERLPEILVRFGEPVEVRRKRPAAFSPLYWTGLFEQKLQAAQDALSIEAQRRHPPDFQTVLLGGAGQGGIYDLWRAVKSKFGGESFRKEHGCK